MTVLHEAWDSGACIDAFGAFAVLIEQKTTKTRCGKRAPMGQIANGKATCSACLAVLTEEARWHAEFEIELAKYHDSLKVESR